MKKTAFIVLLPLVLASVGSSLKQTSAEPVTEIISDTFIGADFSSGIYAYELEKKFSQAPNTIEAWVRMGELSKDEQGGVIFSNYEYYNHNPVRVSVNDKRNICFYWNRQIDIVFDTYSLPVEEWTHISIVRESINRQIKLYINGDLKESKDVNNSTEAISDFRFIIGGDWTNWHEYKKPFKGEIASVTSYSSSLNSIEIKKDYQREDEISGNTRNNLLFSGDLSFNCVEVIDKSNNHNNASMQSNDFFFKGDLYAPKDYSMFVIPDPQIMTHWRQENLSSISRYIINKKDLYNVEMSICVGDNADGSLQWDFELPAVKNMFNNLTLAEMRWVTTPGNHDYDDNCSRTRDLTNYNRYFTSEEISSFDYFGGFYEDGQSQNAYYTFETEGVKYLLLSLEFGSTNDILRWADNVLSEPRYQDHRVIVYTHAYIGGDGERLAGDKSSRATSYGFSLFNDIVDADDIFNKVIRKNRNVFMVFNGHVPYDDIVVRRDIGDYGNTITSMLIDAQGILAGGCASLIALLSFDELNQEVSVNYIDTMSGELFNIQNQFTYSFKGHTHLLSSKYYDNHGNLLEQYK